MEYTFKTKYEKGDIVYSLQSDYCINILRLKVIGFKIVKDVYYKDAHITYLCVQVDKDGNPTGKNFGYSSWNGDKSKLFSEYELYSSLKEIIDEKNINIDTERFDKIFEEVRDDSVISGEDILTVEFPKAEGGVDGC